MWKICSAFFAVTSFCATLLICFMKGSVTRAQVPPFNFGRTDAPRSSPFPDAHPPSEEGELASEAPETRLWDDIEKNCETEGTVPNHKADESPHEARQHEDQAPVEESVAEEEQPASHKTIELPNADGETFEDLFEGGETGLQADPPGLREADYCVSFELSVASLVFILYKQHRIRHQHVCKDTSITLPVELPGEKVTFRCGNAGADLRPGTQEVFQGSACTGPHVPLCAVVPGATLLNEAYAEHQGWTLSIGKLPSAATTVCYQCQGITDDGLPSVCSIIISIAGADSAISLDAVAAAEKSALAKWAVLEAAVSVLIAFILAQ